MKGTKGADVIDELKPFMNYLQAEQNIFPMLGKVMDHNEFLNSIQ